MAYFFTDWFRSAITTNQAFMSGKKIQVVFFRYAPSMNEPNDSWTAATTVADLTSASAGWVVNNDFMPTQELPVTDRVIGSSRYLTFSRYLFSSISGVAEVKALGIELVEADPTPNKLIFVTNTPTGGFTNIAPSDSLTAVPNTTFIPGPSPPAEAITWLLGWATAVPAPIGTFKLNPTEGPLVISRGAPEFEVSGSQHAWMYPQRANMIANPSFEAPGVNYWSSNRTLTRVLGGAPAPGGAVPSAWSGSASGSTPVILESNVFPTALGEFNSEQWTVQLMAKGTGTLKVGLVYWDPDYRNTAVDWGVNESWTLSTDSWVHVTVQRTTPEGYLAMLRLEVQGTAITIDRVLAEQGFLKDWLYFDGDETYGARDDFSWYGGYQRRGASYSFWYNHRKAVTGRLFAVNVDPNDPTQNVTDEDMEEQGLVYRWVPAGITVVPHLDVLYAGDPQNPIPAKPAGVLPYYSVGTPNGVVTPW